MPTSVDWSRDQRKRLTSVTPNRWRRVAISRHRPLTHSVFGERKQINNFTRIIQMRQLLRRKTLASCDRSDQRPCAVAGLMMTTGSPEERQRLTRRPGGGALFRG